MLLDKSYFTGPLALPQLGQSEVLNQLNTFINIYEPEIVQAALGYDLGEAFMEGLDVGSDEEIDQKWIDLRDGILFTNTNSIKKKWLGLAYAGDTADAVALKASKSQSPIAAIVFVNIVCNKQLQISGIGTVQTEGENSSPANPSFLIHEVYNQAIRNLEILWEFLEVNKETYTEYSQEAINKCYFKNNKRNPLGI